MRTSSHSFRYQKLLSICMRYGRETLMSLGRNALNWCLVRSVCAGVCSATTYSLFRNAFDWCLLRSVSDLVQDLDTPTHGAQARRGRIAIYCIAESIDREGLINALQKRGSRFLLHRYPDVLYGQYSSATEEASGDIFYFDYGCIAFWGLSIKQV